MFHPSSSNSRMSKRVRKTLIPTVTSVSLLVSVLGLQSRPRTDGLPLQQPLTTAHSTQEVTKLQLTKPIEREISHGQTHIYEIAVAARQFVGVTLQQTGVDTTERLLGPDKQLIAEFDSECRPQSEERVDFVAETAGLYRVEVQGKFKGSVGRYEIRLAEIRPATEQDRALHEAHRLSTVALVTFRAGKYDQARTYAEQALAIAEKAVPPDHIYIAYLLNELGNIQREKGEYAKAEVSLQRALAINDKQLGVDDPQTVDSITRLGLVYRSRGDYAKALRMLQQALESTERLLGTEHPKLVSSLTNIETVHLYLGDMEQAEHDLQRALTIAEKTLDPDDLLLGKVLNNLANLCVFKKDYERAEIFGRRALAIYEKSLGPDHPDVAYPLLNLGRVAHERKDKDYAQALEMYRRALAIREQAIGREDLDVAGLVNNIANIHKARGEYAKALEMYQRVLDIGEKSGGPYHVVTITVLGNIANLYRVQGDVANAVLYQTRVDERLEDGLKLNLAIGSERQKLAYFNSLAERTDRTISLHVNLAPHDRDACALAALVLLRRKGRVLDAMSGSLTALRQRFNTEDQKLLDQFNSTTTQLAKLVLSGPQNVISDDYQPQLKALQEQKEKLESEISNRSAEFRAQSVPVTLAAVKAATPSNAALIEFAIYRPFDPKLEGNQYGNRRYVAYIVRQQGDVEWKELGEAQAIDAAIEKWRQALRDPGRSDVRDLARAVEQTVMQPVRALLGETTHLIISPEGDLNLIPFEALVDEEGHYLVQRYAFTYLTSGRDLLRMQVAKVGNGAPMVIANPAFGEPTAEQIAKLSATTNLPANGRRRSVTAARDLSDVYFAPLEGTVQEARTIQKLFPDADLLSGTQATESALKAAPAPSILHVATHGFFLQDTATSATVNMPAATRGMNANVKIENPLLRSGLALAGANLRGLAGEDGILTALEASGLNLWGTKLVVLSACDTGVGEVRNREGVYGLRRAFVLAGAQSLVMSLWPVSDYYTRRLMGDYYRNLKQGMGRGAALRQVQLDALNKNKQLHPFYWANFIQLGEWANLDGNR